ncbi:hypothetical protein J2T56_000065 [Natronobacillus azotifigens]|uniref:Uncharacterized protein n=1 Tax=Natronobacillus azotifigens TaxID=472978 RepID=A0A9J6R8T2_9BACI|nr:hypothetical protein [Natronobacillus azotifigens]MCZ0701723.1 hypothetical protein [Natronobacillus azotifigens]
MTDALYFGPFILSFDIIIKSLSFVFGIIFLIVTSPFSRKEQTSQVIDFLIVFFLIIIGSKVLLHIRIFLTDPIAVLAFPSDSKAFYLAFVMMSVYLSMLVKRNKIDLLSFSDSFVRVLLMTMFVQFFSEIIFTNDFVPIYQLMLSFILLLFLLLLEKRIPYLFLHANILMIWGFCSAFLHTFSPALLFGFHVDSWYYLMIGLVGLIILLKTKKKA